MLLRGISTIKPLSLYIAIYSTFLFRIAMFDLVIRRRIESATEFSANIYCNLIALSAEVPPDYHWRAPSRWPRGSRWWGWGWIKARWSYRCLPPSLGNWSSTSSYFHNILAPNIFKLAKLVNDKSSASLITLANSSPHNALVKELHLIGSALGQCP